MKLALVKKAMMNKSSFTYIQSTPTPKKNDHVSPGLTHTTAATLSANSKSNNLVENGNYSDEYMH